MFCIVQEAKTPEEKEQVFEFRYRIYGQELGKKIPGIDHETKKFMESELDNNSCILAAVDQDSGKIVGTVRSVMGADRALPESLIDSFQLNPLIEKLGMEHVSYSGAFMIDPAYRGKTVASLLIGHMYMLGIEKRIMVDICKSELALVNLYYQIGYRPYLRPSRFSDSSGFRQPLALASMDRKYLSSTGSPFTPLLREDQDDDKGFVADIFSSIYPCFSCPTVQQQTIRALWAGLSLRSTSYDSGSLFDDMQEEQTERLLAKFPKISVEKGEYIYLKDEREQGMGVLLTGEIGVTSEITPDPHFLAVLKPPDIFGEMAMFLKGGRTANLIAMEDSEFLLLPYSLLKKLDIEDPELAKLLRNNMCRVLASRLNMMNRQVAGMLSREEKPFRGSRLISSKGVCTGVPDRDGDKIESYSFASLGDREKELQRLENQAKISNEMEAYWFHKIGFRDNSTFLDLGSGPGITSFLLARTFPNCRVIGVEPEKMLRERAEDEAQRLGYSGRCTFVEGTGESIPIDTDSVDFSYCRFLFQHLPEPVKVLKELCRVIRPGGMAAILDVDDMGVLIHPEPAGFKNFREKVNRAQAELGGDRQVSKKMVSYMLEAGFSSPGIDVIPITSQILPMHVMLDIAFSFKAQTLKRVGLWSSEDQECLDELSRLCDTSGAWLYVPVFMSHGNVAK